jgi:hypothetical protein
MIKNFVTAEPAEIPDLKQDAIVLSFEDQQIFVTQSDAQDIIINLLKVLAYQGDSKALEVGKSFFECDILPEELAIIDQVREDQKRSVEDHTCINCGKDMMKEGEGYTLYENIIGYQCINCHERESL